MYDILLRGGLVYDGLGSSPFRADIAIKDGRIYEMGEIGRNASTREKIDIDGGIVCPGFIDVNNHSDTHWRIFSDPTLESLVRQGITTMIGGACGSSLAPLLKDRAIESIRKWIDIRETNINWQSMDDLLSLLSLREIPINYTTLVGHNTLRRAIIGDEHRPSTQMEIDQMVYALRNSLKEGALGLSFGLAYTHAKSADDRELGTFFMEMARAKRISSIHLRNEGAWVLEALEEVLEYAKQTNATLHISHAKIMGEKNWKLFEKYLSLLDEAVKNNVHISFDIFPYNYTGTVLYTLLPDWVSEGGRDAMLHRLRDRALRRQVKIDMQKMGLEYENIYILNATFLDRALTKKSILQIAQSRNSTPEDALIDVLLSSEGRAIVRMNVLFEKHIEKAIQHPLSIIASDGAGYGIEHRQTGESVHPRCFGCFPRFLSYYVKERKLLSWEEAIYKITGFPAKCFGIEKRGVLQEGNYADITIFDPETIEEKATIQNPYQYAQGINHLIVNGKIVLRDGVYKEKKAGMVIRKK